MVNTWERLVAEGSRQHPPAVFPTNACSPKLLRLPGEPGGGPRRTRIVTRRPRPIAARVADVRALRRDGIISRGEARELLGFDAESTGRQLGRAARKAWRLFRRVRWL